MKKLDKKLEKSMLINNDDMLQIDKNGTLFYEICFCPFCRTLFTDELDLELKNTIEENLTYNEDSIEKNIYKCNCCLKTFTVNDLKRQTKSKHKPYQLSKNTKKKGSTTKLIREIINEYYEQGYTYRRIHQLTRFSIEIIQKSVQIENTFKEPIICSKKELLKEYIQIKDNNLLEEKITKSLEFGCSYKVIEKLFSISSKTIKKMANIEKNTSQQKVSFSKNTYMISFKKN